MMKSVYILLLVRICALPLHARTAAGDSALSREMILEKEYNPIISSATKINPMPELRKPQASKSEITFSNYTTTYEVQPALASLPPKLMFPDMNVPQYAGYASLRLGNNLNFDGDAACRFLNTGRIFSEIYFSRRSSDSHSPSLQVPSGMQRFFMNDNWGGLNFSHNLNRAKLSAGLKYIYSAFNYSGLAVAVQSTSLSPEGGEEWGYNIQDSQNQVNNMLEAHVGIFSDIPGQFNYKANLKYTYFKQKYAAPETSGARENRIIIDWDLHNNYNGASKYGLSGVCKIYNYGDDAASLSVVALTPYYHIKSSNLNLTLGARADFEVDGRKEHIVSPHIRFSCNPSNTFAFYASALGGRTDNGNYSMFYENRYVSPAERIRDSRTYLDGTAGVRYLPVSNLCLDVFVGYRLTEDEHFFTPLYDLTALSAVDETTGSMLMGVSYGTDRVAKLGAQVNYAVQDLWGADLKGTFYRWNIDGNIGSGGLKPEAYHKPRFEAEADVYFRMSDIPLRMDLTFKGMFGRRTVALPVQPYLKMKDAYDLFVKANYTVAPYFSVNLSASNLLFRNYDIWYGYPAQKFNIMGGISILF